MFDEIARGKTEQSQEHLSNSINNNNNEQHQQRESKATTAALLQKRLSLVQQQIKSRAAAAAAVAATTVVDMAPLRSAASDDLIRHADDTDTDEDEDDEDYDEDDGVVVRAPRRILDDKSARYKFWINRAHAALVSRAFLPGKQSDGTGCRVNLPCSMVISNNNLPEIYHFPGLIVNN